MDLINTLKTSNASTTSRKEYSLTEIVGIMALINEGVKIKDLALLTNRSVHSLRYKFFEKTALKGKEAPRSVQQYGSMEALYQAHDVVYSEEDLARRVTEYKNSLTTKLEG